MGGQINHLLDHPYKKTAALIVTAAEDSSVTRLATTGCSRWGNKKPRFPWVDNSDTVRVD